MEQTQKSKYCDILEVKENHKKWETSIQGLTV